MLRPLSAIGLTILVAACQSVPFAEPSAEAPRLVQPAVAPGDPGGNERPVSSQAFAQAACGGCHALERHELSPNPQAPAFADIANREGLTTETLSHWLRDAHNYPEAMDFDLTSRRVDELTAHILALRDPDHVPPSY